ncbi:MAG TPA: hypothetical protein PK403_10275, partial [Plasticicumulans sp.]|nr:hypothetical protein [Plasticicumulans sp.]
RLAATLALQCQRALKFPAHATSARSPAGPTPRPAACRLQQHQLKSAEHAACAGRRITHSLPET